MIYLDSAHEQGETLIELALYWNILQPGGILFGDDWSWMTVRCDVKKFVYAKFNNRASRSHMDSAKAIELNRFLLDIYNMIYLKRKQSQSLREKDYVDLAVRFSLREK